MVERRKYKRLPINLELEVNRLFRQDNDVINDINAEIQVTNVSKTGIGFISTQDFPLNYYFNAKIEFAQKKFFYCVIKIIRKEKKDDEYYLGCEFVGLAEFLAEKVDEYEKGLEESL